MGRLKARGADDTGPAPARQRSRPLWLVVALGALVVAVGVAGRAHAAPRIVLGPVLADVRPDAITVVVELDQAAGIEIEAGPAGGTSRVFTSGTADRHELVLSGLRPDTTYDYVVRVDGVDAAHATFTTAPPDGADVPVRFLVYGDTRDDVEAHADVARAMRGETADFVLHTGDLVGDGREREQWQAFFDATRSTFARLPLYTALGNHDSLDERAVALYREMLALPGDELHYRIDHGPVRILVLDSNAPLRHGSPQRRWLDAELDTAERAPPKHLFVLVHAGPFSSGYHGENPRMRGDVETELRRAGVELLFEGHDHAYERGEVDGLKYLLSGGGGAPLYVRNAQQPYQLAFLPEHHYVRVDVHGDAVRIVALSPAGEVLDACSYRQRRKWDCAGGPGRGRGTVVVRSSTTGFGRGGALIAAVIGAGVAAWWQRRRRA